LLAIVVLAAVLRIQELDRVHIEHFDEGVYASNRWFTLEEEARYPNRHLYAPPLLPALLEWSQLLLGTGSWGVLFLPVALGTLTVGLVWWLMRHWTGPVPALATALIAAISEPHILYSRTALTDVPMIALMLLAVGLAWQGIAASDWKRSLAAGIVAGLCWSTKYNGWFPLAVSGAGLGAFTLFHVKRFGGFPRAWVNWLLMSAAAAVVWLPAWRDLQQEGRGGYSAVQENHARYVEGLSAWFANFQHQFANLIWFESSTMRGILSGLLIVCGCVVFVGGARSNASSGKRNVFELVTGTILVAIAGALALGPFIPWHLILFGAALFGYCFRLREAIFPPEDNAFSSDRALATWFCLAWFVSLLIATPLYRPYPRLALPLLVSLWVGVGFAVEECFRLLTKPDVSRETNRLRMVCGVACLALIIFLRPLGTSAEWRRSAWQSRQGVEETAASIIRECERSRSDSSGEVPYVIYTYAEPALFYQLCRLAPQDVALEPVSNLGFVSTNSGQSKVAIFLAAGPHAEGDEEFARQLFESGDRLKVVSELPIRLSDLVMLNHESPAGLSKLQSPPISVFRLFRMMNDPADSSE
jgi:4-amino-4-deoxy-L-arabinose transferase-like glycosyltransferase